MCVKATESKEAVTIGTSAKMTLGSNDEGRQYHIALCPGEAGEYCILPGDPGRVAEIAGYLENSVLIANNREYLTYAGTYRGKRVSVTSTGIGGPSAAIAVEELVKCGVHTFIRIGTCGGMQPKVHAGDVIIPTAAIRAEGTSAEYLPSGYPAAASFEVVQALQSGARELSLTSHVGVVHSKDSFYGQTEPDTMPVGRQLRESWQAYISLGCLASEMECAAIFSVGMTRGVRVGAVLTAIWNPELDKTGEDTSRSSSNDSAIRCALAAIERL